MEQTSKNQKRKLRAKARSAKNTLANESMGTPAPSASVYRAPSAAVYRQDRLPLAADTPSQHIYLKSLLEPEKFVSKYPDDTVAATGTYKEPFSWSQIANGDGGVVWVPNMDAFYVFERYNGSIRIVDCREISSLADKFSRVRVVSGEISAVSAQRTSGTVDVQGFAHGVYASELGPVSVWTAGTFKSKSLKGAYCKAPIERGVKIRYVPQGINQFRLPHNSNVASDVDITTRDILPTELIDVAGSQMIFSITKDQLPNLALGRVRLQGMLWFDIANVIFKDLQFRVYRTSDTVPIVKNVPLAPSSQLTTLDFWDKSPGDIWKIELAYAEPGNIGRVEPGKSTLRLVFEDASHNVTAPLLIAAWEGLTNGASVNIEGCINYEVIPDSHVSNLMQLDYLRPGPEERMEALAFLSSAEFSLATPLGQRDPVAADLGSAFKRVVTSLPKLLNTMDKVKEEGARAFRALDDYV